MMIGSLYHQIKKHERKNRDPQYWREICEQQEELIHDLYRLDREASHMRHDMKGKLDILYRLLMKEKYKEAEGYLEKLGAELGSCPELPQDTGNEGLNAVLMRAVRECREKGIYFRYLVLGRPEEIDDMDMGDLLYNLLSNGIEASIEVQEEKELEIMVRKSDNEIEIEVENSIKESVLKKNPCLKSSKREKEKHGFGMESVQKIVEKYCGEYTCYEEEHRFIQKIILRI